MSCPISYPIVPKTVPSHSRVVKKYFHQKTMKLIPSNSSPDPSQHTCEIESQPTEQGIDPVTVGLHLIHEYPGSYEHLLRMLKIPEHVLPYDRVSALPAFHWVCGDGWTGMMFDTNDVLRRLLFFLQQRFQVTSQINASANQHDTNKS